MKMEGGNGKRKQEWKEGAGMEKGSENRKRERN